MGSFLRWIVGVAVTLGLLLLDPVKLAVQKEIEDVLAACKLVVDVEEGPELVDDDDRQLWRIRLSLIGDFKGERFGLVVQPESSAYISDMKFEGLPASIDEEIKSLALHPDADKSCRDAKKAADCKLDINELMDVEDGEQPSSIGHGIPSEIEISSIASAIPVSVLAMINMDGKNCGGLDQCIAAFVRFESEDLENNRACSVYKSNWFWRAIQSSWGAGLIVFLLICWFSWVNNRKGGKA